MGKWFKRSAWLAGGFIGLMVALTVVNYGVPIVQLASAKQFKIFLDLDAWPAFNLADTFIVVGVGLLFLSFVAADRSSAAVGTSPLSRS